MKHLDSAPRGKTPKAHRSRTSEQQASRIVQSLWSVAAGLLLVLTLQGALIYHYGIGGAAEQNLSFRLLQNEFQSFGVLQRNYNVSFLPNWRVTDLRCGPGATAPDGSPAARCNPFSDSHHCCSHWGWCGAGDRYCNQGVVDPDAANSTDAGMASAT